MNYRIETMTQHGKEINHFYARPEFSYQERTILDVIGKRYFQTKQGTGMAADYRCKFVSNYEIFIYALGNEIIHIEPALNWANELYKELKEDLDKTIENIYLLPFMVRMLQHESFSECLFNHSFVQIRPIADLRKAVDELKLNTVSKKEYDVMDSFIIPTIKDMNNIQVMLRDRVNDLESNLSKVAANSGDGLDKIKYLEESIEKTDNKLADAFMDIDSSINSINSWIDEKVKSRLDLVDTLNLEYISLFNIMSKLEKHVLEPKTPWYLKLWNKLTIFWSEM